MKFEKYYRDIIYSIKKEIFKSTSIEDSICLAEIFGNIKWKNNDGIYYDEEVEFFLWDKINKYINFKKYSGFNSKRKNKYAVMIASELYNYGGHTKVVINWLKQMQSYCHHEIIITRSIPKKIKEKLNKINVDVYEINMQNNLKKIEKIVNMALGAEYIILHIHPDDIVATLATKILSKLGSTIIFYNHADHVFSYAIHFADVVCEISKFGWELSKMTGRIKNKQVWLGIPLSFSKEAIFQIIEKRFSNIKEKTRKIIVTGGSAWKYEPFENLSFPIFIDKMLELRRDIIFLIIGSSGNENWWRKIKKKWGPNIKFIKILNYEEYVSFLEMADIYIDSFPVTGGTAFPEALLNGIPAIGLKTPFVGYSCIDNLRAKNLEELIKWLDKILNSQNDFFELFKKAIDMINKFNSDKVFGERLKKLYKLQLKDVNIPPQCNNALSEIDLHWLHRKWQKQKRIFIMNPRLLKGLSFAKRFKLLMLIFRSRRFIKKSDLLKVIISTILGNNYEYMRNNYICIRNLVKRPKLKIQNNFK